MPFTQLFVLVEGPDDERFVKAILEPRLISHYDWVRYYQFSKKPKRTVKNLLSSLGRMDSADYLYFRDINRAPCVSARKDKVDREYGPLIDRNRIIIVVAEIESWYLAGLDDVACRKLRLDTFARTDDVPKERFNDLKPREFESRIDFMIEVLKRFSADTARLKNRSFDYLMRRITPV